MKEILCELRKFIDDEHKANLEKLYEIWDKPLSNKLALGETQSISQVERIDQNHVSVTLGENESRYREGDLICLHKGDPREVRIVSQATIEAENDGDWLLRVNSLDDPGLSKIKEGCYADPDTFDLKSFYDQALEDIAKSSIGRDIILPLFAGTIRSNFVYEKTYDEAALYANSMRMNEEQCDAVGLGVAAEYLACIQGPPGTGKTKVISMITKLLVDRGHRILLTSHTHMAINNALNKVKEAGVPVIKVGVKGSDKSLSGVTLYPSGDDWHDRPKQGFVIGATPFATCTKRLEQFVFDTIIFDEASQVTLPLAIMAMRKGSRFVFVGDHKQLPPVVLSAKSFFSEYSVFSKLRKEHSECSVMLNKTYRMNKHITAWPSKQYYNSELVPWGDNINRQFSLTNTPNKYSEVLSSEKPIVFIKTPTNNSKNSNLPESEFVAKLVSEAIKSGLSPKQIGIVVPFRNHAKVTRNKLKQTLGSTNKIIVDTVERMQGQEMELVIISFCASDPVYLSNLADFLFMPERLNVAITRAKTKLIVIGPTFSESKIDNLENQNTAKNLKAYSSLISSAWEYRIKG